MSHNINGFIGPIDELKRLTTGLKHARIAHLNVQGLGFLPYTQELSDEIGNQWYKLGFDAQTPIVHVETEYFGGFGEQSAAFYYNGEKVFKGKSSTGNPIDQALKYLGVVCKEGMDEFDTVGLGNHRSNERWAETAPREFVNIGYGI